VQVHEAIDLVTAGTQHATSVAAIDSYSLVAGSPFHSAAGLFGVAQGESLALFVEHQSAEYFWHKVAFCLRSQVITYVNPSDCCRQIKYPSSSLLCEHCRSTIHTDKDVYCRERFPSIFFN